MFCGDRTVHTLPTGFFINAETLVRKFSARNCTVLCKEFSVTSNTEIIAKYSLRFYNKVTIKRKFNNARRCELYCSMATATESVKLTNAMVPHITSSRVVNIMHFKNHLVPL
jgi:hypothetical protein